MTEPSSFNKLFDQHDIFTVPVPERLALRPGLVNIWIRRTSATSGETWDFKLPVQWTKQ